MKSQNVRAKARSPARPRKRFRLAIWAALPELLICLVVARATRANAWRSNPSRSAGTVEDFVRRFESSYRNVRTLRADFVQTLYSLGQSKRESGTVEFARRGRMRWEYQQPESKIFVSNGTEVLLYVPDEKQLTRSPVKSSYDARVPLRLLLSRLNLHKVFAKIEFADQAINAEPGDRVLRAFPKGVASQDYRAVLIEVTPNFDVRRLVVLYPDNSTMQFEFTHIERDVPVADSRFEFTAPQGTQIIEQ